MSAPISCLPLSKILNLSIQEGIYPEMLKKSKVTHIFKKSDKFDSNNYRPMSVLPIISYKFEMHISNCVTKFMDTYDLIYHHPFGFTTKTFMSNSSNWTSRSLTYRNKWEQYFWCSLVGLYKSVHVVSHNILLQKLRSYKFIDMTIAWLNSYLSDRNQQIHVSGK